MASGVGGHTGGAIDVVPEVFDEAGHRVATQYLMAAIRGFINPDDLKDYRSSLPSFSFFFSSWAASSVSSSLCWATTAFSD